jgi:hypothetical protein
MSVGARGEAFAMMLVIGAVSCGGRTESGERPGFYSYDGGPWDKAGAGGVIVQGAGGRTAVGAGGRVGRGAGGRGTGGAITRGTGGAVVRGAGGAVMRGAGGLFTGAGGIVTGTGGRPVPPPDVAALIPAICLEPCKGGQDCPSTAPYAGGCNGLLHACLITCENGCPPDTQSVSASGGCFCYDPRVSVASPGGNACCSSYCGPPYYLPCCGGFTCMPGGKCCPGAICL